MMNKIALLNGLLIDGNGNKPQENCSVFIENDKIQNIVFSKDLIVSNDTKVIDVKGKTILPGFINAHVHNGFKEHNLTNWAYEGVTTIRDLTIFNNDINPFEIKSKINKNSKFSRLVSIGYLLTTSIGYPFDFIKPPFIQITNKNEAIEKTKWLIQQGADIVKMILESNSYFGEEVPILSDEIIESVVKIANQNGTIACAHVTCVKDLQKAVKNKVNDIVHMPGDLIPEYLLKEMVDNNTYVEPTFELWKNAEEVMKIKTSVNENFKNFISLGGKISLGNDYDGWPDMISEKGMPLKEINLMNESGMSPLEIITSCTKNASFVCNLSNVLGTIEIGKIADIQVVNGNPINNLAVLKGDKMVIHNGDIIRNFT